MLKIVQITAAAVYRPDYETLSFFALGEDGSIWMILNPDLDDWDGRGSWRQLPAIPVYATRPSNRPD